MGCFKRSIDSNAFFAAGVLFYVLIGYLLRATMHANGMSTTNVIWSGMSVLATTLVGVLLFKETIRAYDMIAIAMVVAGIMLLQVSG